MNGIPSFQVGLGFFDNSESLKALSTWLQWLSISLVFVSGALQLARFIVDRREKQLQTVRQNEAEKAQREREQALTSTVKNLKDDLENRQAEIEQLSKRTVHLDPVNQPIRSGTATVEVILASKEQVNAQYMDRGGYLAFGRGTECLTILSSTQCSGRQLGDGRVLYRGVFSLDASDSSVGKPAALLNEARFVQVSFLPAPQNSEVVSGKAICVFNNSISFEIEIPAQRMSEEKIIAPLDRGPLVSDRSAHPRP